MIFDINAKMYLGSSQISMTLLKTIFAFCSSVHNTISLHLMNKLKLFISFLIFLLPFMVVDFTTPKGFALLVCLICLISNIYIILQCFKCFDCLKCFLFNLRDCSKFFLYKSF